MVAKDKQKPVGADGAGVGSSIPTVATHDSEGLQSLQKGQASVGRTRMRASYVSPLIRSWMS